MLGVVIRSQSDKDYSQQTQHLSTMTAAHTVFAGFIFTIITLLLTQLTPDFLNSVLSQIILFILYTLFEVMLFLIIGNIVLSFFLVKTIPPRTRYISITNYLWCFTIFVIGILPILLFLLWNLIFLVFTTIAVWLIFVIAGIIAFVNQYSKMSR